MSTTLKKSSEKGTRSVRAPNPIPSEEGLGKVITLLTDFGNRDGYVSAMKGVILSINPRVQIVDVTHSISSHQIQEGAFVLKTIYPFFPKGTIHLTVVDPGVGSERMPIIVETERYLFVGPDNGLFSYVYEENSTKVWEVTEERYFLQPQSDTFHGRDIFAPIAAYLSLGVEVPQFGRPLSRFVTLSIPKPEIRKDEVVGHILHIDRFGNLVTDVQSELLKDHGSKSGMPGVRGRIRIEIGGKRIDRISRSYSEGKKGKVLALIGGSGLLEISVNEGRADEVLPLRIGDPFVIRFSKDG